MSIDYNRDIPFSTHNPSTDQPNMLDNTNAIDDWVKVDHVGFNVGGGEVSGQHNQVTFNSNNVPTLPTGNDPSGNKLGILFTNTVGSGTVNQLFYYAGTDAQSADQYDLTGTPASTGSGGSTFLFGGIIVKWGFIASAPDNTAILFNVLSGASFPNACYAVFPILQKANTSTPLNVTVNVFDKNSFTLRISKQSDQSTTTANILYFAIGN